MDNMDLTKNTIALDSDGDEILDEIAQKTVSFKDQETRMQYLPRPRYRLKRES